jgi:hypothetical protein
MPDQQNPADAKREPEPPNWVEIWGLIVLVFTFIAAFLAACEAHRLVSSTERAIKASDDAAEKQRQIVILNGERQLRAYLQPKSAQIICSNNICNISITVKNYGQTPAYTVTCAVSSTVKETVNQHDIAVAPWNSFTFPTTGEQQISVGPGEEVTVDFCAKGTMVSSANPATVPVGKTLYVLGLFNYVDSFQRCQHAALVAKLNDGLRFVYESDSLSLGRNDTGDGNCTNTTPLRAKGFPPEAR